MYNSRELSNFHDVGAFHAKFGLDNVTHNDIGPRELDMSTLSFRVKFLLEELTEYCEALGIKLHGGSDGEIVINIPQDQEEVDNPAAFDALLDMVYVAMGTAHLHGYPWQDGWEEVQKANMSKVRAKPDASDSARGSSLDVVKPEGWTPPDIEKVLEECGWDEVKK